MIAHECDGCGQVDTAARFVDDNEFYWHARCAEQQDVDVYLPTKEKADG